MAAIDYGAVIFKNGIRYKGDKLYPSIDELCIDFYKVWISNQNNQMDYYTMDDRKYSDRFVFNGAKFHIKRFRNARSTYYGTIYANGDIYNVVFGYGIDNNKYIWRKAKTQYLGKYISKRVDNVFNRIGYYDEQKG